MLAVLASVGQVIVPIAVQQTLDRGLNGPGGPDVRFTVLMGVAAAAAIVVTSWASYAMTSRLFTASEKGLATLRIKAFRQQMAKEKSTKKEVKKKPAKTVKEKKTEKKEKKKSK